MKLDHPMITSIPMPAYYINAAIANLSRLRKHPLPDPDIAGSGCQHSTTLHLAGRQAWFIAWDRIMLFLVRPGH